METDSTLSKKDTLHARAAKGGIASGVSFAINFGLTLVQVPLLLRFWPQETYGLWLSVGALSTLLTSLDVGHQAYVGNLLSRYYVEDRQMFRGTLASAVLVAAFTSTLQIVLAGLLCFTGVAARWLDVTSGSMADFSLAVLIYTIGWISVGSVGSILTRVYLPSGHFVRSTWWAIGARVVQFLAVSFSAWLGWGLVRTTQCFAVTVVVYNVLMFADIRRLYPELFPWWKGGDCRLGVRNLWRAGALTFVSVLDLFSLQGVVLLVGGILGAAAVPLFTTLRTLANTAMQGAGFLLSPIQAVVLRYHVQKEADKISAVFGFFWLMTGVLINGGMVLGLYFVEPIYGFWTHGKLGFDRALFGWLAMAVLVRTLSAPMQNYLLAINHLRAVVITAAIRALLSVVGIFGLAHLMGLAGIGAALFVAEVAGSMVFPWWFCHRSLASLGSKTDLSSTRLAVVSTLSAGLALGAFGVNLALWPWLAAGALVVLSVIALMQWRELSAEVKARVLSIAGPLRSASQFIRTVT